MTSAAQALRPLDFPLWGSRLIEASAGTGKTWTIAALYLRLVLGHGIDATRFGGPLRPDQVLVMTFTRAATRELSDRIRARLLDAAKAFRGELDDSQVDPLLHELLAAYEDGEAREAAAWRLATAAEGMDDAAVHTIDAWCQRMLREHAFDSGSLFDEELLADEQALWLEAAQDYWRQQCYPLDSASLNAVLSVWRGLPALVADVRSLGTQTLPEGAGEGSLADCLRHATQVRAEALAALRAGWVERAEQMRHWLQAQCDLKAGWEGRSLQARYFNPWLDTLATWARGDSEAELPELKTGRQRLTPAGVRGMRKADAPAIDLPPVFEDFESLLTALDALPEIAPALRLHAAARVSARLDQLKRQAGQFGFADLLSRLDAALQGPNGDRLRERILAQTPVALIDEFQDTSALQFRLFDRLYDTAANARGTALLLIGDPKQSIYRFRGADIHSYLQARAATAGRHYVLDTNYRSTEAVVQAVNAIFLRGEQREGEGAFGFRQPGGDNPLPFLPVAAAGRRERFVSAQGAVPALLLQWQAEACNAEGYRQQHAALCAEQIVGWLNDAQAGFAREGAALRRLRPADIAVLVRNGTEARAVRRALRRRGVASVFLSDRDSVFASPEAADLLRWLRAVAQPTDVRLVRAALATATVGLSLDELAWLARDDEAFDARAEQLRALRQVWLSQGVLTLLRRTLHELDLPARWLPLPDGERRLTNYLHLAELLQAASSQLDGELALIRWLTGEIAQAAEGMAGGDEQIVRLESDADLVQVVTVHKSKGLEYPVVCLPFAGALRPETRRNTSFVALVDEAGRRTLDLSLSDESMAQAERERLREDLRLLYVALTRARHALWLGLVPLAVGSSRNKEVPDTLSHLSAIGYLLGGPEPVTPEGLQVAIEDLAAEIGDAAVMTWQRAPCAEDAVVPVTRLAAREQLPPLQDAPPYPGRFDQHWGIASFSSLVRAIQHGPSQIVHALPRPADDETAEAEALPGPVRQPADLPPWHRFERGAIAGNFLHDQLEWLAGERFGLGDEPDEPLAQAVRRRATRAGRTAKADDLLAWLRAIVRLPLPGPGVALAELDSVLPEMEFWLPAGRLPAAGIDALCRAHLLAGQPRPVLPARELHGMLMGFADLVFEHEGRYWVLDYKSNQLGADGSAYTEAALAAAMGEHRYDVQAALYLLALHRLLRARLGDAYDPAAQLGGALYLFLRGIDGPTGGVCLLPADVAWLDALDALLQTPEAAC